jgi:CRP-like cAMP-binding protein
MAVKRPVVNVKKKQERKTPVKPIAPLPPGTASEATLSPAEIGASPDRTAAFDPRAFLAKLTTGKSKQEYQDGESVFSQGDAADAVFYLQSGKVKLTVVSKHGKEAVVAILPEASFFGEGCLAGQPIRMATARTVERSTIIRV